MDNLKFNINYATLVIGIAITATATILVHEIYGHLTKIETYVSLIGTGITLTTLVYAAMNVHLIYKNNKETLELEKKKYAAHLISEFNSPEMMKLSILGELLKKEIQDLTPKEVSNILEQKNDTRIAINSLLNFHEKVAISIDQGLANEEFLKDFFQEIIKNTHLLMSEFINHSRRKHGDSSLFIKFEELANKWTN